MLTQLFGDRKMKYLKKAIFLTIIQSISLPLSNSANAVVAITCQLGAWFGYTETWGVETTWLQSDASSWDDITFITIFTRVLPTITLRAHSNTKDISDKPYAGGHILTGFSTGDSWKAQGQTLLQDNNPVAFASGSPCGPIGLEIVTL
jgi:hypothetical protein